MGYVIRCDKVTKKFAVQGEMHGEFWVRGRKCHTLRYGAEFGVRFPECPQCVILRSNCLIQIIMATHYCPVKAGKSVFEIVET